MKILVINCGSSSLKFQLYNMDNNEVLAKGLVERIGIEGSNLQYSPKGMDKIVIETPLPNHDEAIKLVMDKLVDPECGVISDLSEINGVGHRVVHGSKYFTESCVVTEDVMEKLNKCVDLAPLHNPANIMGIKACEKLMPGVKNVVVFDTAFHQTMPAKAYMYALPYEYYEKYDIRKYGFHGTSHRYVSKQAIEMLGNPEHSKIITCHLGNGSSIAAVKDGKVIDTTMGFTPLAGFEMGTRCGDIDPAIVPYIMKKENLSVDEMDHILNKESGVLGISGVSSDFRDIEAAEGEGNERATSALDLFAYRVAKTIGEYVTAMKGVDAIVFTAGLGENSATMRQVICDYLRYLGIELDSYSNSQRGKAIEITTKQSRVQVFVIPTNEELVIARDTRDIVNGLNK